MCNALLFSSINNPGAILGYGKLFAYQIHQFLIFERLEPEYVSFFPINTFNHHPHAICECYTVRF